jgi:hypothetical protein
MMISIPLAVLEVRLLVSWGRASPKMAGINISGRIKGAK